MRRKGGRKHPGYNSDRFNDPEMQRWAKARTDLVEIIDEYKDGESLENMLGIVQVYRSLHPPKDAAPHGLQLADLNKYVSEHCG